MMVLTAAMVPTLLPPFQHMALTQSLCELVTMHQGRLQLEPLQSLAFTIALHVFPGHGPAFAINCLACISRPWVSVSNCLACISRPWVSVRN